MRPLRKAASEVLDILGATTPTHLHFRDRLAAIVAATVLVDLVCSIGIYLLERHAPGGSITNYSSALFFSTTQLLTVSSNFSNPHTGAGQVLDVLMEVYAITVVAALAGATSTFTHHRSQERRAAEAS